MGKKLGKLRLSPKLLHMALRLPEDVVVEHIQRVLDGALQFELVLSGDALPVDEVGEGCPIPTISGFLTTEADDQYVWQFPDYRDRPIVEGT